MNAKRCDRCKKFYERNEMKYKGKMIDGFCLTSWGSALCYSRKDLCDDCLKSLDKWFLDGESEVNKTP